MLNKAKLVHRRKRVVGGKTVYTHHKFTSGGMIRVHHIKRRGKVHVRPHGHTSSGGKASTSKRATSKSVNNSILRSLSKRGGTISKY